EQQKRDRHSQTPAIHEALLLLKYLQPHFFQLFFRALVVTACWLVDLGKLLHIIELDPIDDSHTTAQKLKPSFLHLLHIVQLPIYHDPIMTFLSPFFRNIHFNQWMVLAVLHFMLSVIVELVECARRYAFLVFLVYRSCSASLQLVVSRFFHLSNRWSNIVHLQHWFFRIIAQLKNKTLLL